jgi:ABC-type Fe3+ transport system permease subunit
VLLLMALFFLPIGVRMMQAAVIQIHKELEEAGRVSGAASLTP